MKINTSQLEQISIFCLLVAMSMMFYMCDEDNGDGSDPLVGKYVFTSATFNDTVHIKVMDNYQTFFPGYDASFFVSDGLLGAAPCDNADNAGVDLRENGTIYYTCFNETNESQMGIWLIDKDRTILTLNISNPRTIGIDIKDLEISESNFKGTVSNFPLPVDTSIELGDTLAGGILRNIQLKSVDVVFDKEE